MGIGMYTWVYNLYFHKWCAHELLLWHTLFKPHLGTSHRCCSIHGPKGKNLKAIFGRFIRMTCVAHEIHHTCGTVTEINFRETFQRRPEKIFRNIWGALENLHQGCFKASIGSGKNCFLYGLIAYQLGSMNNRVGFI